MSATRACPFCGQQSGAARAQLDGAVICSRCGRQFTISDAIFTPPTPEPKLAPLEPRLQQSYQPPPGLFESPEPVGERISTTTAMLAVGLMISAMVLAICGMFGWVIFTMRSRI